MAFRPRSHAAKRQMAYAAAAMFAGAAFVVASQALTAGGPSQDIGFGIVAGGFALVLVLLGGRLPVPALACLGPFGTAMIGGAIATTPGPGDGAALYAWPVLWTAYYFGRSGSIGIVAWTAVVHAVALSMLPGGDGYVDRWIDVMVSVAVVAAVVQALATRNRRLLGRFAAEARADALTGLLNRRGFDERAAREGDRAARTGETVAAVSFDIDYFKRVNDEWGHDAGDRVLAHLGRVLRRETRDIDVVARMGGEEFVALLWVAGVGEARAYAERVRRAFAAEGDSEAGRVTVSAGVAAAQPPETIDALIQRADSALYRAKLEGRDRTVVDRDPANGAGATVARVAAR